MKIIKATSIISFLFFCLSCDEPLGEFRANRFAGTYKIMESCTGLSNGSLSKYEREHETIIPEFSGDSKIDVRQIITTSTNAKFSIFNHNIGFVNLQSEGFDIAQANATFQVFFINIDLSAPNSLNGSYQYANKNNYEIHCRSNNCDPSFGFDSPHTYVCNLTGTKISE